MILLVLTGMAAEAQTITRTVKLKKGQEMQQVVNFSMNMTMSMMGQEMGMAMESNVTSDIAVQNAGANNYTISSTIKRMQSKTSGMGQDMVFDSDKSDEADPQVAAEMNKVVGKKVTLELDKNGIVLTNDDSTLYREELGGFKSFLSNMATTVNKPGNTYALLADLPSRNLKVGDTWEDSVITESGKMLNQYKILSINDKDVTISLEQTASHKGLIEQEQVSINMAIEFIGTGEFKMDKATGLVKQKQVKMKGNGTMETMGQEMPFSMNMDMNENVSDK